MYDSVGGIPYLAALPPSLEYDDGDRFYISDSIYSRFYESSFDLTRAVRVFFGFILLVFD